MLNLSSLSQSCVKCAKCVPSCTIYQINRDEVTSPRGFVDLLGVYDKKNINLDRNLKNIFESCFLCTTCTTICPQKIDTAAMIQKSRIDIAQKYGIAWYKKVYFYLLKHRKIMDFVFSLTSFVAPCVFKKNDDRLRSRFSISSFGKRSIFPFQKKSFLQTYKGLIESKHKDSIGQDSKNLDSRIENLIDTPHSNCNKLISKSALLFPPLTNSSYKKPHFISFRLIKDAKPYEKNSKTILRNKKVAIFIGCLSNYNYTQVGESLLFILDKLGIDVLIPKQECCGAPAYFTGDIKSVIFLIKKNIELFESFFDEIDAMIIPEATCAAMIMVDWKHSLSYCEDSKHWIKRLEALLPKIHMATEYLYNQTNLLEILKTYNKKDIKITYHDPCHAKKVLNIAKEPRAFIEANYNLLEMKECDRCCGFGGVSIQSEKYHLAYNAGIPKAKNILDSGASIVSAECSACRMQLNNALDNQQANIVFKHPLELVRESLRC